MAQEFRAKAESERAWEEVASKCVRMIKSWRKVPHHDAEDAVQSAVVTVCERCSPLSLTEALAEEIARSSLNKARSMRRASSVRRLKCGVEEGVWLAIPAQRDSEIQRDEQSHLVCAIAERRKEIAFECLYARIVLNQSIASIGMQMSLSPVCVYRLIERAKRSCRREVKDSVTVQTRT